MANQAPPETEFAFTGKSADAAKAAPMSPMQPASGDPGPSQNQQFKSA